MRLGVLASSYSPFPHPGHYWAMRQAIDAVTCDAVIAALHIDPSLSNHSKQQPAMTVSDRTNLLLACRYVDGVVAYQTEADLLEIMRLCRPVVRIIGEDHRHDRNTGDDLDPPIPVFWANRKPEWSGTQFARRIHDAYRAHQERNPDAEQTSKSVPGQGDSQADRGVQ